MGRMFKLKSQNLLKLFRMLKLENFLQNYYLTFQITLFTKRIFILPSRSCSHPLPIITLYFVNCTELQCTVLVGNSNQVFLTAIRRLMFFLFVKKLSYGRHRFTEWLIINQLIKYIRNSGVLCVFRSNEKNYITFTLHLHCSGMLTGDISRTEDSWESKYSAVFVWDLFEFCSTLAF